MGITALGVRRRCIETAQVRRVHLFIDANGDAGIVVRKNLWHFVHLPAEALQADALRQQVKALVEQVRATARVDAAVDEFLAAADTTADRTFVPAA